MTPAEPVAGSRGSLRLRVLLSLGVLLLAFFAATVAALEWSLSASLARARAEVLEAQLIALMAAAEPDEAGMQLTVPTPPDRRMALPASGLYGEIRAADGATLWRSPSAVDLVDTDAVAAGPPGVRQQRQRHENAAGRVERQVTVNWEFDDGSSRAFTFVVSQSLEPYRAQQRGFRVGLISWFTGLTLATLVLLSLVLRHVLRPLGRIEREIGEIEQGRREALSSGQPAELAGVARNLNALLGRERGRQQRYRDSLANLAHSLKTPLAAMQATLAGRVEPGLRRELSDGITRMDRIIGHQLKRAEAFTGRAAGTRTLPVAPVVEDLLESLAKVYRERQVEVQREIAPDAVFQGEEGDLQELLGNLLDNAWKYGHQKVTVTAELISSRPGEQALDLRVEDDGAGLDPAQVDAARTRGMRLDESLPGQGIGLAVVSDIVEGYGGHMEIGRSALGGALIRVSLPVSR
ncbi:MAG: HAMP domain-containing protein [Gammaproteobacteria bacterium]|nr:MAG: HAMP domain-containing protein [Gammaproteobacteria bacterium]